MHRPQTIDECFDVWKVKINEMLEKHPLQIISWEATRRCNLNCVHCGSPHENVDLELELSTQEIIEAFDQIAQDFDMSQFRHINVTGGEPFVRDDLLLILREISKYPFYRNIDIQTNGLFLAKRPDIISTLIECGVTGIGVSIDGLESTHDSFRRKKGGFNEAVRAAKSCVEAGFVVTASVVVHAKNLQEIPTLFDFIRDKVKPRVFRLMFIDPIGRTNIDSEYLLTNDQKMHVIKFLQDKYMVDCGDYSNPKTMMVELGCGGWFGKELEGTFRPFIFHCIAGMNNLGILYDGKIASCSNISREFIEGDLRKDKIREIWENKFHRYRNRELLRKDECVGCEEWSYCHGGPMHLISSDYRCLKKELL
jgi:radical SAM protein with 4Fe4S-binding SPASM domain